MNKSTLGLLGAMGLILAAAAAWRAWHTRAAEADEAASAALYQHKPAPTPNRKGDADSFTYVRSQGKLEVADISRSKLEDYVPQTRAKTSRSTGTRRNDIPLSPIVEELLEMMPPPRVTPHVDGRPQLIPAMEPPGGAPLQENTTSQKPN